MVQYEVRQIVKKMLSSGEWPVFKIWDDNPPAFDEDEYVDFVMKFLELKDLHDRSVDVG